MAPDMCPTCLDFGYDKYQVTSDTPTIGIDDIDTAHVPPVICRNRTVLREQVEAAADAGCNLCRVLKEGMLHFWGDKGPYNDEDDDEEDSQEDEDDEEESEGEDEEGGARSHDGDGHGGMTEPKPAGMAKAGDCRARSVGFVNTKDGSRTQLVTEHDDDHQPRQRHRRICIELRPGRSLIVTWIGPVKDEYCVGELRPQLEFFADAGE
jgi:hypothetical protein